MVKNDSNKDYVDDIESINELSVAEQVFARLQIYSEGFKPAFFTEKDLSTLSLTSKTLNEVASAELTQRAAKQLLTYVLMGEQNKAEVMIKANPSLLLIQSKAVDYSGRTIIGTAFRAALGAGDKPMWEMILPYCENLKQGEALRQFNEQFPKGIEDEVSAEELQAYYNAIALAIINDEDHGVSVIEGFRKEITCQKEITQGKHFNLQHLIAAYQAYIDNFDTLDNWDNRDLFWQKVIGYVQRQMTGYDAQIHCSGVESVLDNESSFSRTFELLNEKKLFPLQIDSGLGFDFACYSYYGVGGEARPARAIARGYPVVGCLPDRLEKLCGEKTNALAGLRESLEQGVYYQLI
ncbi:hypothetical protein DGG96_13955 [Legionella qingyii]|uniref:SidC N-terminal domain-containing protein n=1 Tax=Legionella qingyii TaxID=2184757 RepID=A0A317U3W8_9GAMM|nr:hypothetical protein DGG96_13955 [Legionella qingyii]RUR22704.1 hypothetical protein ELY16_14495 [Legionella qingyii]RUR26600.1 hypothetical protein ELY20_00205 [Legionella qingyii]